MLGLQSVLKLSKAVAQNAKPHDHCLRFDACSQVYKKAPNEHLNDHFYESKFPKVQVGETNFRSAQLNINCDPRQDAII